MSVGTSTALIIGAVVAAGAATASAEVASHAAKSAASTQSKTATTAAGLQAQLGQEGVNLTTEQLNAEEQNTYPFLSAGYGAEANLSNLLGLPVNGEYPTGPAQFSAPGIPGIAPGTGGGTSDGGVTQLGMAPLSSLINPALGAKGSLLAPFGQTFTPPTLQQAEQYPGYQFQLQQGLTALQNSAAARGNLLTGQTQTDINNYAQNTAQTDYTNVYNQQLQQFQQAYNIYQQQQANTFNRLSALSGGGQVAAQQLASAGQAGTGSINNILLGTGNQLSADYQNAAAARASGYVGSANAIGGGLSSLSSLAYLPMLNNLFGGSSSAGAVGPQQPAYGGGGSGGIDPTTGAIIP